MLMDKQTGALAAAQDEMVPGDPTTPDETQEHEGAEAPEMESAEEGEDTGEGQQYDPKMVELMNLVTARALDALAKSGRDLDLALKADPVRAAVQLGTSTLRTVAMSAEDAGKPLPFEVLMAAGINVIKELGAIANEKGYLPDDGIETYLKEAFQQSLVKYAQMDMTDGKIDAEAVQKMRGAVEGAA
jgi:hypothetical protein